jgi:hypothetical protein
MQEVLLHARMHSVAFIIVAATNIKGFSQLRSPGRGRVERPRHSGMHQRFAFGYQGLHFLGKRIEPVVISDLYSRHVLPPKRCFVRIAKVHTEDLIWIRKVVINDRHNDLLASFTAFKM